VTAHPQVWYSLVKRMHPDGDSVNALEA